MAQEPALDGRGLMGAVIVEDQVQLQFAHRGVDGCKEAAKLDRAVALMELTDHGARLGVERAEQVDGAVAQVVRSSTLSLSGASATAADCDRAPESSLSHPRTTPVPVRRIKLQAHDAADFFNEQRVFGELETFHLPVRLQRKGPPDAAYHDLTQPAALGHLARARVRSIAGSALRGQPHYSLNLRVTDLTRRPPGAPRPATVQPPRKR